MIISALNEIEHICWHKFFCNIFLQQAILQKLHIASFAIASFGFHMQL